MTDCTLPPMENLQISPQVIAWAASRMGLPLDQFASKISKRNPGKIKEGKLTESQALRIAKEARIKLGDLFLSKPPAPPKLPIADFRTTQTSDPLSDDFFETFRDIEFKQDWYRDYLEKEDADPLPFIGKYADRKKSVQAIALDIRETLGVDRQLVSTVTTPDQLYAQWVARAEAAGILVFKNGVVGNSTRRTLSVSEFRGFVISDTLAPVIFINGNDAPAAWLFTLAHELAHLWLGESGVSDVSPVSQNAQEVLCNRIAAEALVPVGDFVAFWEGLKSAPLSQALQAGRQEFKVSELVLARRALDSDFISHKQYQEIYLINRERAKTKSGGGGDFYLTHKIRNSKTFTNRVANLAANGKISFREAGHLLRVSPNRVMTIYKKSHAIPA